MGELSWLYIVLGVSATVAPAVLVAIGSARRRRTRAEFSRRIRHIVDEHRERAGLPPARAPRA
jgi:hypothetical protein